MDQHPQSNAATFTGRRIKWNEDYNEPTSLRSGVAAKLVTRRVAVSTLGFQSRAGGTGDLHGFLALLPRPQEWAPSAEPAARGKGGRQELWRQLRVPAALPLTDRPAPSHGLAASGGLRMKLTDSRGRNRPGRTYRAHLNVPYEQRRSRYLLWVTYAPKRIHMEAMSDPNISMKPMKSQTRAPA